MKMEHIVVAPVAGVIEDILVAPGDTVFEGETLLHIAPSDDAGTEVEAVKVVDLDHIRGRSGQSIARHAELLDEGRPDAVARRRKTNQRTARENVADLCDSDSFIEYGGLALAAQRQRRSPEELRRLSPADGLITGVGTVNGELFGDEQSRCAVMAYDYTVFAGTQGVVNHKKKDRLLTLADKWSLPVVLFAEAAAAGPATNGRCPPASKPPPSAGLAPSMARCRSWVLFPAAASPEMPRCLEAPMSSSPTGRPTSAWADRR